ncbi:MAG TPA: hypothetical protein VHO70_22015 [Chitinispirillaceae bacterium]|nr:hypothetical protein [Chitinispirillaceae bacterium]
MAFHLDYHKMESLLEIIERNRWEKIRRLTDEHDDEAVEVIVTEEGEITSVDVRIVVFASETPFRNSLEIMLSEETVIADFNDPEKAINFVCDNKIKNVVFDIDPPSNVSHALDVLNALKILNPAIHHFACTKRMTSQEKELFERQGAVILEKPILRKQVAWLLHQIE